MSTPTEGSNGPLVPGQTVHGLVITHNIWGVQLALEEADAIGTVDLRFMSDDPTEMNQDRFRPIGTRLTARVQGFMPNGQLRLTLRSSEVALDTFGVG